MSRTAWSRSALTALVMVAVTLAGCSDSGGSDTPDPTKKDPSQLKDGTGAIAGLLLDDRYRPIAGGRILLQETGERTQSNDNGEFYFVDLQPGSYRLRAEVTGHEALPITVSVEEGFFAEQRLIARRTFDTSGTIITQEYAVFIPCAADYVANGGNVPCSLDFGDNEYSSTFSSDLSGFENVTYVVTEFRANQENGYEIQIRPFSNPNFATANFVGDYVKIVNRVGEANTEHVNEIYAGPNIEFDISEPFQTIFFVDHADAKGLVPGTCCGLGASMGIKGTFVQSVFLGEPEEPIENYKTF